MRRCQLLLPGNHDYKTVCGDTTVSVARDVNHKLFRTFFDAPPYHAVVVGPWRLLLLNSMLGYTWEPLHPRCKPMYARVLRWLCVERADTHGHSVVCLYVHAPVCACCYLFLHTCVPSPSSSPAAWQATGQSSSLGWMHSWQRVIPASCLCTFQCQSGTVRVADATCGVACVVWASRLMRLILWASAVAALPYAYTPSIRHCPYTSTSSTTPQPSPVFSPQHCVVCAPTHFTLFTHTT